MGYNQLGIYVLKGIIMKSIKHLVCPVCHKPLLEREKSLTCENSHSFDIAGKGYVNLLLSQDKNSKDPGDNKDMAKAGSAFWIRVITTSWLMDFVIYSLKWLYQEVIILFYWMRAAVTDIIPTVSVSHCKRLY